MVSRGRFVGRADELACVTRCLSEGSPAALLVTGEPGIGKSRLVAAAADQLPHVRVVVGNCLPLTQSPPLLAFADALWTLRDAERGSDGLFREQPAWVSQELARFVPALGFDEASGVHQDGSDRFRMYGAIRHLLHDAALCHPTGVVIEDVHWADEVTLDALMHLLGSARGCPVPVVLTAREQQPRNVEAILSRLQLAGALHTLSLAAFTSDETAAFIRDALGVGLTPAGAVAVHKRAGGNPLFIDQLVSHGSTRTDQRGSDDVPRGLTALIADRLEQVDPEGRQVMQALAFAARPLNRADLATITGLDIDQVADQQRALSSARLLRPSVDDPEQVEVSHELLAEVLRGAPIPHAERRRLHATIADTWSRTGDPSVAGEIADHLHLAGKDEEELPWRILAGEHASTVHAPGPAAAQFRRAIRLWADQDWIPRPDVPVTPWRLHELASRAADLSGDTGQATALAEQAYLLFAGGADATLMVRLQLDRAFFQFRADAIGAEQTLNSALWLAEEHGLHALTVHIHEALAGVLKGRGLFTAAVSHAEAALHQPDDHAHVTPESPLSALYLWLRAATGHQPRPEELDRAADAVRRGQLKPATGIEVAAILGELLVDLGRIPASVDLLAAALTSAEDDGIAFGYWPDLARYTLVEALLENGSTGEADLIAPASRGSAASPTGRRPAVDSDIRSVIRAAVDLRLGHVDAAYRVLDQVALPPGIPPVRREFCLHQVEFAIWRGDPARALENALVVVEETVETGQVQFVGPLLALSMRAAADLAASAVTSADHEQAEGFRDRLASARERAVSDPFGQYVVPIAATAHGLSWDAEMARLDGDSQVERWQCVASAWASLGRPHREAYARWRQAQALIEQGATRRDLGVVVRAAAEAARGHEPLGAAIADIARVARVPLHHETLAPDPFSRLTPREKAVLTLVAQGRTNAEIGRVLHISGKTAGVHVSNILHKLGVTSRLQAATWATRVGIDAG